MIYKPLEKQAEEFVCLVSKLNAFEFMGILKLLSVPIFENEQEITKETNPKDIVSRQFEDLLDDAIDTFCLLNRARRREILKLLREVRKEKSKNGTPTKN